MKTNVVKLEKAKSRKKMRYSPDDMVDVKPLIDYREKNGLTWKQIREPLGVPKATFSNWINRRRVPKQILAELGITGKVYPVKKHVRTKAEIAADAQTLYAVKIPGSQDKIAKSILTAMGCSYRKIDI